MMAVADAGKRERDRRYDARRRKELPWRRWYDLAAWKKRSRLQLLKEPRCERHLRQGKVVAAVAANHIEPHRGDWTKFLRGRLESACAVCHNRHIQREELRGYDSHIGEDGWPIDPRHPFRRS